MKRYIGSKSLKLGRWLILAFCVSIVAIAIVGVNVQAAPVWRSSKSTGPKTVTFYGAETSPISSAVAVPENQAYFWTSGTVPPVVNPDAPPRTRDRYGDTKTQAISTLQRISDVLQEAGLSLNDVVYLRAYLVADSALNSQVDFQGWFDAYAQFFNTETNPTKVARSTVAVAGLVDPGWLIEIEAVAVYPKK